MNREKGIMKAEEMFEGLKGANKTQLTLTDFVLNVTDPEEWNKNIAQLAKEFWGLIKEAYGREDDETERQLQVTFENAKNIYARTDGKKIIGFCSVEQHSLDPMVGIIRDIIVEEKERGKGLSKDLYSLIFSQCEYGAIVGVSVNFAAIKTRIAISEQYGYKGYYGSMGSGDSEVERLRKLNMKYMSSECLLADKNLPEGNDGFVLIKTDVLPPLTRESASRLDPSGVLFKQAQEILKLQNDYPADTVAGHLINIKEDNDNK